jgi:hypothetical protein
LNMAPRVVMPGLVPGIHVLVRFGKKDVDGRTKSGHDGGEDFAKPQRRVTSA